MELCKLWELHMREGGPTVIASTLFVAGPEWKEVLRRWNKKLENAIRRDPEVEPPLKQFTPKNKNLEVLEENTKVLGKDYWDQCDKHDYVVAPGSIIDHEKLVEIAERLELKEQAKVEEIAGMLEHGADLGIEGEGRWASEGENNPTVYEFGARVADLL